MVSPSSLASARYAVYAWTGAPDAKSARVQPGRVGTLVFPSPLNVGSTPQPVHIGNNLDPRLGEATFSTRPTPTVIGRLAGGIARRATVTLQGFIEDGGSQSRHGVSITNAVILRIRP